MTTYNSTTSSAITGSALLLESDTNPRVNSATTAPCNSIPNAAIDTHCDSLIATATLTADRIAEQEPHQDASLTPIISTLHIGLAQDDLDTRSDTTFASATANLPADLANEYTQSDEAPRATLSHTTASSDTITDGERPVQSDDTPSAQTSVPVGVDIGPIIVHHHPIVAAVGPPGTTWNPIIIALLIIYYCCIEYASLVGDGPAPVAATTLDGLVQLCTCKPFEH
ncbi:hypothetical protein BKA62DRAFT_677826 [Auriculariales sp. MPI-PUGE-AT-0066]|nr:hypothetical protein BKA62DRAFT_677826 [Auriculariales sp. MPI-PUGE-AT-0066]